MTDDKRLGALPSKWDEKRTLYQIRAPTYAEAVALPEEYDGLRNYVKIYNQGSVGSCTGWSAKGLKHVMENIQNNYDFDFSAGFLYHYGRIEAEMDAGTDGCTLLGVLKVLNKMGVTTEDCAPTDTIYPFTYSECPDALSRAFPFTIESYHFIPTDPASIKAALYGITFTQNYQMPDGSPGKAPIYTIIPVYDSFYSTGDDGIVPVPTSGEVLGGYHAVIIVGWKKINDAYYWIIANSWGEYWGDNGFCYLPWSYPIIEAWVTNEGQPNSVPASFIVSNLVIDPVSTSTTKGILASVIVENGGTVAGNYTAEASLDGVAQEKQTVMISGRMKLVVVFKMFSPDAGIHTIDVCGLKGAFMVVAPIPEPIPIPDPTPEPPPVIEKTWLEKLIDFIIGLFGRV